MAKRVSLKDIAEKVGVSTALVSYVMNGQEKEKRVGADAVERIREVANELNYQPNRIAQSLRTGSTKTIGLVVADIANPFFGNLARVIEDEASNHGYTVIFCSSDEDFNKSASLIDTLVNRQVDGFIIAPAEGTMNQIKNLQDRKIPVVLIDRYFNDVKTNYVSLDNFEASFHATSYLIERGYRKIGMVAYKSSLVHMQERIAGYTDAMKKAMLESEIRIEEIRYSMIHPDCEKAMKNFLENENRREAIFFATNALTISGLYIINQNNLKVPDDIAIVGFDGNEAFDFFYSPLTYIEQPITEMGKKAVCMLMDQIHGSNKIMPITMLHKLVQRKSCK